MTEINLVELAAKVSEILTGTNHKLPPPQPQRRVRRMLEGSRPFHLGWGHRKRHYAHHRWMGRYLATLDPNTPGLAEAKRRNHEMVKDYDQIRRHQGPREVAVG